MRMALDIKQVLITNQRAVKETYKRIRKAREIAGLNQTELAKAVNVTPQAVQQWEISSEQGGTLPRQKRLLEIANILNVDYAWLSVAKGAGPVINKGVEDPSGIYYGPESEIKNHLKEKIDVNITVLAYKAVKQFADTHQPTEWGVSDFNVAVSELSVLLTCLDSTPSIDDLRCLLMYKYQDEPFGIK